MIDISGSKTRAETFIGSQEDTLVCPHCGAPLQRLDTRWLGDISQPMVIDTDSDGGKSFDYRVHQSVGENYDIEYSLTCTACDEVVAEREVTINVGEWKFVPKSE